ncbi:hypothetical protein Tco_0344189 [Tanacetum coccineum]
MARALIDVHGEQMTLRHDDQSITFKVGDTKSFFYNTIESVNRIDAIDVACEEIAQEVLGFSNISESGNPTPTLEPILSTLPPSLTPFRGGEFMLEEIEGHLADNSFLLGIDNADFDSEGDLLLLEKYLNNDPISSLPPKEQKFEELKTVKSSSDEPPELELKDLPPHLEYAFLEAWKIFDIKGIDLQFCTHKILMEEDTKPTVQLRDGLILEDSELYLPKPKNILQKRKTKRLHRNSNIKKPCVFPTLVTSPPLQFLLLKIFLSCNVKTPPNHPHRWTGPFTVAQVFPYGTIELSSTNGPNFKVNGHRLKHYFGGDIPPIVISPSDLQTYLHGPMNSGDWIVPDFEDSRARGFLPFVVYLDYFRISAGCQKPDDLADEAGIHREMVEHGIDLPMRS